MLSDKVKSKLESLSDLPAIPVVVASVLQEMDNPNFNAKHIASLIEQDQGLSAKILKVANSPFYGLTRKISTIDLAIVILGSNILKEILISILLQKVFRNVSTDILDIKSFWQYAVFCGATARYLARKFKYKLVSETFISGLMHDIGILVLLDKFKINFSKVRKLQKNEGYTLTEAEMEIFECTHADVGAWIAERWNLPEKITAAFLYHHTPFYIADEEEYEDEFVSNPNFSQLKYPLAAITAMAEWLSFDFDYKKWDAQYRQPLYYITDELVASIVDVEILGRDSAMSILHQGVIDEYAKASSVLSFL